MRSITLHGIPLTQNCSAPRARRTDGSRSGTQDACRMRFSSFFSDSPPSKQRAGTSNSSHPRFLQSRSTTRRTVNHCSMSRRGTSSSSCPTGRTPTTPRPKYNGLPWTVPPSVLSALVSHFSLSVRADNKFVHRQLTASAAMFNHTGDSVILTHMSEHAIRIVDVPSLTLRENLAAHVGGCIAAALDPRGRYLASGGYDSIVNLFDTSEWIAARTITVCECVR